MCENLGWDVGFFWTVEENARALRCTPGWHRSDVILTEFEAASFSRTFAKGEGLPGSVWSTGKPRWLLDVVNEPLFPRACFRRPVRPAQRLRLPGRRSVTERSA